MSTVKIVGRKRMAKHTILYVEDEQWMMGGIVDSLSVDYNVVRARNGDQALALLESGEHKIDLIVLDIMMPPGKRIKNAHRGRTAGVEFARIVLQEQKRATPIVCYTVVNDRTVHRELEQIGVKDIVPKRELPSELERVIRKYLR
jgi:CheY-like chemotaxis protein